MSIWIDPQLSSDLKAKAKVVMDELELNNTPLRIRSRDKSLTFTWDRRVVDVPIQLIEEKRWEDIRFLFRAILNPGPSAWNLSADSNDWSPPC